MTRILANRVRVWLLGGLIAAAFVLSAPLATTAQAQDKDEVVQPNNPSKD